MTGDLVTGMLVNYAKARQIPSVTLGPSVGLGEFRMRQADVQTHPADTAGWWEIAQDDFGLGYCHITRCCPEVCPAHIKITGNALIPLKERVAGRKYDPLAWLGSKVTRRASKDTPSPGTR